ncbi:hypothetical protein Cgig2_008414 [Carnegiea gigantea]|uniref:Uncharacterized protein n=1 Tax=Carnegiea gigantea TaxID=171969 RepID=A0A9Q1K317_9CARY|nr:hypothetical protein Cgig2_008414 [Carnegiea gigantea]
MQEPVGGMIVRSFLIGCEWLKWRPSISDTGCIHPGTLNVALFMALAVGPLSFPFPLCFVSQTTLIHTSLMVSLVALVKLSHFMSKRHLNLSALGGAFAGTHPSSTDLRRLSRIMDITTDLDFDNFPNLETILCYQHVHTRYGTGSQLLPSPHASDSKRKQSDLSDMNISKDEGKLSFKPKIEFVHSWKPLEHFVAPTEDGSFHVEIQGIDVAI